MSRYPCSGCGLHSCEGECFQQCPSDFEDDPETWLTDCTREAEDGAGVNERLAPRRRAA
jgi:hypothetical protein